MTPALRDAFRPEYAHEYPVAPGLGPLPIEWRDRWVFTEEHVVALLGTLRLGGAALGYAVRMACGLDVRRGNDDAAAALAAACEACPALAAEVARAESEGRQRLRVEGVGGPPKRDAAVPLGGGGLPPVGMLRSGAGETEQEGGEGGHAPQDAATATAAQGRDAWAETMRVSAAGEAERAAETRSKRVSEATDDGAPDWQRIRQEAAGYAPGPFGWVLYQEDQLAHSGENFPALSPFSLYVIEGFFLSGKRWLLWMAGRGFGKSTLTARLATAIGFGVQRRAAPGPAWVCPLVSVLPVDADRRLEDIQKILLHAYHQETKPVKSMIATQDGGGCAIAWVSSASTIGNVSGPSSFAALVDEEEKILFGRAGGIIGSLAFTFRSRHHVYGMRVSSAMTTADTLAGDCDKGPNATNFVATLGPFLASAVDGLLAVAAWEEQGDAAVRRAANPEAAHAIRAHAALLTADSWQIPTWLGHPTIGIPTDAEGRPVAVLWGPGDAAIATRIDAEAVPEKARDGLLPWRYWLRECCSVPTGEEAWNDSAEWKVLGEPHRNAGLMAEDRWAGMRDER